MYLTNYAAAGMTEEEYCRFAGCDTPQQMRDEDEWRFNEWYSSLSVMERAAYQQENIVSFYPQTVGYVADADIPF